MIELKQNKIWSDSLSTTLGLAKPWDELEKPLQKFICFGEGGDSGGGGDGGDSDAETDVEFGEPTANMTTAEAVAATTAAEAVGGLAGIGDTGPTTTNPKVLTAIEKRNLPVTLQQEILAKFEKDAKNFNPFEVFDIQQLDQIPLGLDKPHAEVVGLGYTFSPKAAELYGAPTYSNLGFSFSPGEFAADIVDVINPLAGLLGRQALGLVDKDNVLGLNTQNPISEIAHAISPLTGLLGLNTVQENLGQLGKGIDTGKSAVVDAITSSLTGTDTGVSNTGTDTGVSNTGTDTGFGEPDGSGGSTGLASVVQQNPLEVRPQDEVQSSASGTSRITRRPFNFTPGRIFAQTGGGIQDLINKEPTLLDVVNKGMAMPEETVPAQRPQQFISGQQQPGGLRSTNYYTNAMQPASFYAQPQQVKNYGSIY